MARASRQGREAAGKQAEQRPNRLLVYTYKLKVPFEF